MTLRTYHGLGIAASHRSGSLNRQLLHAAIEALPEGFTCQTHPYSAYDLPLYNDTLRESGNIPAPLSAIREQLMQAQFLLLATPEYNGSIPANIKNLIDWVSTIAPCPFARLPVLLMTATPSRMSGQLGLQHMRVPLEHLGAYVYPQSFLLQHAHTAFVEENKLEDPARAERLHSLMQDFCHYSTRLLKPIDLKPIDLESVHA